jgi:hypothetical protein
MATLARWQWFPVALAAIAAVVLASTASGRAASTFPCRWSYSLYDGLRQGFVTAGDNADCSGRQGSLTLSVRLLRLDPATKTWHTVKNRSRRFRHLSGSRFVEVASPCAATSFRAVFRWTLRGPGGAVVARHRVSTRRLVVTSPDCQIVLSGPGTPLHSLRPAK